MPNGRMPGPFRTDHWEYVFGNERPKPNLNRGAGLDVSPAVRDYLGLPDTDVTDWKFVEFSEVPPGPWASSVTTTLSLSTSGRRNNNRWSKGKELVYFRQVGSKSARLVRPFRLFPAMAACERGPAG